MDATIDVDNYKLNVRVERVIMHKDKILVHKNIIFDHYELIGESVEIRENSIDCIKISSEFKEILLRENEDIYTDSFV